LTRLASKHLLFVLLALAVGLLAITGPGASAATPKESFPYCSWWAKTTPETANIAFPDAAATYWTTPFYAEAGLEIEVEGKYPNARYMSFNVYDEAFGSFEANGVSSGLADYQINPAPGSVNPFQASGGPGGSFTVTLSGDARAGEANTLPLAPTDAAPGKHGAPLGFLVYRTYLPTGGNGTVPLPTLRLVSGGKRVTLPRCPAPTGKIAGAVRSKAAASEAAKALAGKLEVKPSTRLRLALRKLGHKLGGGSGGTSPCRGSTCPPPLEFFRAKASTTNAFFPNVDNAYVSALFRPVAGTVIVVRGKAATTPPGTSPVPWPQSDLQLRYWSLCNNIYRSPWPVVANPESGGGTEYGCAADLETHLDAAGEYAFVVANPAQRTAVEAAGGTFVPLSTVAPHARQILIFRNMLPNSSFKYAVQNAPQTGEPTASEAAMGAYYPRAFRCTLAQFRSGNRACG
jgi:hypothetical protein